MRRGGLVLCVVVAACTKDKGGVSRTEPSGGSESAPRPAVAAPPVPDGKLEFVWDHTEPLCPRDKGPRKTSARMVGDWIRIVPQEIGFAVQRKRPDGKLPKDHAFHTYGPRGKFMKTIPGDTDPGSVISFDSEAWYSAPCEKGKCDRRGFGHDLLRVDRKTAAVEKLYGPEAAFVTGQLYANHFYWASTGADGTTGALRRVLRKGTTVETLWQGRGVASLLFVGGIALLADQHSLFSIPLEGGKPTELVKDLKNAGGLAAEGDKAYVIDRGDDLDPSSGRVLVVDLVTGTSSVLATRLPMPTVVTVDGDRLDIMGEGHGNVIAVPRAGGTPTLLIPAPSADWSCHTTAWIHADESGLRWLRMHGDGKRGSLFSIPRSMLADPIKQWRELMSTRSAAGSGSGSASEDPDGGDLAEPDPQP